MPTSEHLFQPTSTHSAAPATLTASTEVVPLVLLVANDGGELESCALLLNQAGLRVSAARTGFEALVKATCYLPELVVIQEGLAAEEGVDGSVAQQLLHVCPATAHIPVISCSALRSLFGASAALTRPEILMAAVQKELDLAAAPQEH